MTTCRLPHQVVLKQDRPSAEIGTRVSRGLIWNYSAYGILFVAQAAGLVVLARLLDPEAFGIFAMGTILVEFANTGFAMGLGPALIQKRENAEAFMDVVWTFNLTVSLLLVSVLFFVAPWVATTVFHTPEATGPMRVLLSVIVLTGLSNPGLTMALRRLDMKKWFWATAPAGASRFLIAIVVALVTPNVWALVIGYVAWYVGQLAGGYAVAPYLPRPSYDLQKFKELYSFGGWLQLQNIVRWFSRSVDSAVVGALLGANALGFYNRSLAIAGLPEQQVRRISGNLIFPMFASLQGDNRRLRIGVKRTIDFAALNIFPLLGLVLVLGEEVVTLLLGAKWLPLTRALQVLMVAVALRVLALAMLPLFRGIGDTRMEFRLLATRVLVTTAVVYPLTSTFGIEGAALSILIGAGVVLPMTFRAAARLVSLQRRDWAPSLAICTLSLSVFLPFALLPDIALPNEGWAAIILGVAGMSYLGVLIAVHSLIGKGPIETLLLVLTNLAPPRWRLGRLRSRFE